MAKNRIPSMAEMTAYLGRTIDDEPIASLCAGCKNKEWPFVQRKYLMARSLGFELKYGRERVVETIFLNRFGRNGYAQFPGRLPKGIKFGDSQARVHAALGKPTASGRPVPGLYGRAGTWDRYEHRHHRVHFSYADDGGLELVMLMLARSKARKGRKAR